MRNLINNNILSFDFIKNNLIQFFKIAELFFQQIHPQLKDDFFD